MDINVAVKSIKPYKSPRIIPKQYPTLNNLDTFTIKNNPYSYIYIDLTYACNMHCHYCYNPVRTLPDIDLDYFKYVCENLPRKVQLRLLGGEPTMYEHLEEACQIAHKNGHFVSIITNGIKFVDKAYAQSIKDLGIPTLVPGLTMNGGRDRDDWYAEIDNAHCSDLKVKALENIIDVGFRKIYLAAIVIRDFNEGIIKELYDISREHPKQIKNIHYRTAGNVGRWNEKFGQPYTATELQEVVADIIPGAAQPIKWIRDGINPSTIKGVHINSDKLTCRGCCREYYSEPGLLISIIEFGTDNAGKCWRRGKLNPDGTIQSFFAGMREFTTDTLGVESCDGDHTPS